MPLGKRQRKFLLCLGIGLGGILLLWLSVPFWFPLVLRPAAKKLGASFAASERKGYGRIIFHHVVFTNRDIKITAERVDTLTPTVWLWRRAFGNGGESFARVDNWRFELVSDKSKKPSGKRTPSIPEIIEQTDKVLRAVRSWIPAASISSGTIAFPYVQIGLGSAEWKDGNLKITDGKLRFTQLSENWGDVALKEMTNLSLSTAHGRAQPWQIKIKSAPMSLDYTIDIRTNGAGLSLQSTAFWLSNQFVLNAEFDRNGLLPNTAILQAPKLKLSGEQVGLKDYSQMDGTFQARWTNGQFLLDLTGSAIPVATQTNLPPMKISLYASGDTNSVVVHTAQILTPLVRAELSKDFQLYFTGPFVRAPAAASLWIDFTNQTRIPAEGVLTGDALIEPGDSKFPNIQVHLRGSDFGVREIKTSRFEMDGALHWPLIEIGQLTGVFSDGSSLTGQGKLDLDHRTIANGHLNLKGCLLERWLPADVSSAGLEFDASVGGPFDSFEHNGRLTVTNLSIAPLSPLQIQADWKGQGFNAEHASLIIAAGESSLLAGGVLKTGSSERSLALNSFTLTKASKPLLALQKPSLISIGGAVIQGSAPPIRMESFDWQGAGGHIVASGDLNWPSRGTVEASIQNVESDIFDDFLGARSNRFSIHAFHAKANWTNGPLHFAIEGSAGMRLQKELPLSASLNVQGNNLGITISNLMVNSQTSVVATAEGFLPISFDPQSTSNRLRFNAEEPFHVQAATDPNSVMWEKIAQWSGLMLVAPDLKIDVGGTLQAPRGVVQFDAARIKMQTASTNVPALDDIDLAIDLDQQAARISRCQFSIQGQLVHLTGELPLGSSFWSRDTKLPDWKTAQAHLSIPDAQLAPFTPIFPNLLSPQGELTLDLDMKPGAKFEGNISISQARTRPLANLGPVRNITLKLGLRGQKVSLDSATANIGGADVIASGQADLERMDWRNPAVPPFKFILRGTNVPLSRKPDSIIRSDLDLAVTKTNTTPAVISGTAHLRNSFFLHDLADLVPAKVATPSRRPPYFSIDAEPLADWRLAVHVTGERFLKVRSTIFHGEVSANLNVLGTLKEPLALGDVRVDSGLVRFPFANLKVQQGFVTLGSKDPYRPQLTVHAGSRQYGYDIKMEGSGPVDAPVLQFSSTPPLSSEQIVLMVTAGELPRLDRSLSTQQRAQTLALFVGRDLLTKLGFGDESEQRLTLHSGEQLSEQGRPTYNVEYKLTDRWSLVGEYDRFNAFNAGLKWRVYSK